MPILKLRDIQLYYDEYGSGDRFLISAAMYHSKYNRFTNYLGEHGFHVFNITIRGHGLSTHVSESYGKGWYDVWVQDVLDFADAMGIDRFFYAGVSHGAGIGWHLCRFHPERIRAFFSIVGGPHTKKGEDDGAYFARMIELSRDREAWRAYTERSVARLRQQLTEAGSDFDRLVIQERIDRALATTPDEQLANPPLPFPDAITEELLIDELRQIKLPTLMVGGMRDGIIFPENLVRSCRAVEDSKLIIYEDGGHDVAETRMSEVIRDVLRFCEDRKLY